MIVPDKFANSSTKYDLDNNTDIMGKKPQRDPGAPKRNMSAYLLYQNAMREQFKALNPGMTFGQLGKSFSFDCMCGVFRSSETVI